MKKLWFVLGLASFAIFPDCTKDQAGPSACFQEDVLPIFISNCTMSRCHNSTDRAAHYDFTNYEGIMQGVSAKHPLNSEIYKTIRGRNPSMPEAPYPPLSAREVSIIKLWINKGAKNTSNCRTCDTSNVTYSLKVNSIISTWCTGCHNSNTANGGYDLSDHKGLVAAIKSNRLMGSIRHEAGFSAMPQGGVKLSDCDLSAIQKWIDAGYPDN